MAVIAWATQQVDAKEEGDGEARDVVILTESLTTIQIVERWTLQDFSPDWVTEANWDILLDLLEA